MKFMVAVSRKQVISIIFVLALVSGSFYGGMQYVLAQGGLTTQTISSGIYPGAPNFTIYAYNSTYYAAKNQYGVNYYISTDVSYIIQSCFNTLSSSGGTVYINLNIRHANVIAVIIGVSTTTAALNTFENVFISDTTGIGMELEGTVVYPVTLNTFTNCRWSALTTSLRLKAYADTNTFLGGCVEAYHGFGIVLGDSGPGVYNNNFYNVPIDGEADDAFGVYLNSGSESPNSFYSGVFGGSLAAEVAATKVEYHTTYGTMGGRFYNWQNYVTEYSDIVTVSDTGTITIGLVATPNTIQLTSGEENYVFNFFAYDANGITIKVRYWNSTAQNFNVAIGSHTVSVFASYQPKG
jgi:hypothetical protein